MIAKTLSGLIALVFVELGVRVGASEATVINVPPGIGTLQAAVTAANPGDSLHLQVGIYTGPVVVNKSLKIYCYGDDTDTCIIDAACAAPIAVDVTADDVIIAYKTGVIIPQILGGTTTELRVIGGDNVKVDQVQLDQSNQLPCGAETTALEIDASSKVKVKSVYSGYRAYIHDIAVGARVSIGSSGFYNGDDLSSPSVLIENSGSGAELGKGGIRINKGAFQSATDGVGPNEVAIQLVNSDGVRIKGATVSTGGFGATGIVLDANSDANLIQKNRWADGTNGNPPYANNGTGNCFKKNYSDPGSLPFTDSCP